MHWTSVPARRKRVSVNNVASEYQGMFSIEGLYHTSLYGHIRDREHHIADDNVFTKYPLWIGSGHFLT
jgi:hypothetical protein